MRTKTVIASCLVSLCPLVLAVSANAQQSAYVPSQSHDKPTKLFRARHSENVTPDVVAESENAHDGTTGNGPNQVILHTFKSPSHGAYPSSGVIRDEQGNLYGTTNGSYSDIGGGGTNDAGVVFKIDRGGQQTVLYSFTGGADGSTPNAVIRSADGDLYGTASYGGNKTSFSGAGVVFRIDPWGHETVVYTFTGGADGANPNSIILDCKGNLYGATAAGGTAGYGVVFKIDSSGHETTLYTFTGGSDGAYPNQNNVALDAFGNFFGTTNNGGNKSGTAGAGVIFRVSTLGGVTVLYTFTAGNDGGNPNGVFREPSGTLYGTTSSGGASGAGTVFKIDASGKFTTLYTFTGGADGGYSSAGVTLDRAGNIYGTTNNGGTANLGVVFKLDKSGQETVLHTFLRGPEGNQPDASGVTLDPDDNLYGTTSFVAEGGQGAVYRIDRAGNASVVYAFPSVTGGQYLYNNGLIFGPGGELYGSTFYGGAHGAGVLYRLDSANCQRVLYAFSLFTNSGYGQPTGTVARDAAGNFYGTTFIGQTDMNYGFGVVYKVDRSGHATVLHNFTNGADGGNPYSGVLIDPKGVVWGTVSGGGASGAGGLFKIDTTGKETLVYNFSGGADGGFPLGSILRDSSGNFYGMTSGGGGAAGAGVVFKIDPAGNETVLYTFTGGADGGYPLGGLTRDAAGNLYGVAQAGGAAGAGVVFKLDTAGHETVLYNFTGGADGGYPYWVDLVRDAAGNLYGTTTGGGTANEGVLFKVDPAGNETVLHTFTGGDDGGEPFTGVIFGPDGSLYGVTAFGGKANVGVVYKVKP